jgi:hypothetical protein
MTETIKRKVKRRIAKVKADQRDPSGKKRAAALETAGMIRHSIVTRNT